MFFQEVRLFRGILVSFCSIFILYACASSNVSREASSNVDMGVQNAKNFSDTTDNSIGDAYQNSSQATKGAILGGTAGAVTGALTSAVGIIPGAATGLILGASYGSYIDTNTTLQDRMENRGATVIVLGDQILIAIPSARLFSYMSADIKPQAYTTLELITQYINQYTKTLVKVSAYTADSGSERVDFALSKQQAENVAKFLLANGIDARILYAEGYGVTRPIVKNSLDWAESDNYRIEITLEKLYV